MKKDDDILALLAFAVISGRIKAVMPNGEVWNRKGEMPDLRLCSFPEMEVSDFECKIGMFGKMN